jgi:ArsR family transcriptional regulator
MNKEAAFFKVLSDPTRLMLAVLLSIQGETCVCMLAQAISESDFKVSRHLGIMRLRGVVEARRDGTWMYYRLANPKNQLEKCLLDCFRNCLDKNKTVISALKRLKRAKCV